MFTYRILGLMPEAPEGHVFASNVPDLEQKPELWERECPYTIGRFAVPEVIIEGR